MVTSAADLEHDPTERKRARSGRGRVALAGPGPFHHFKSRRYARLTHSMPHQEDVVFAVFHEKNRRHVHMSLSTVPTATLKITGKYVAALLLQISPHAARSNGVHSLAALAENGAPGLQSLRQVLTQELQRGSTFLPRAGPPADLPL